MRPKRQLHTSSQCASSNASTTRSDASAESAAADRRRLNKHTIAIASLLIIPALIVWQVHRMQRDDRATMSRMVRKQREAEKQQRLQEQQRQQQQRQQSQNGPSTGTDAGRGAS
jgi:hypothetical protein